MLFTLTNKLYYISIKFAIRHIFFLQILCKCTQNVYYSMFIYYYTMKSTITTRYHRKYVLKYAYFNNKNFVFEKTYRVVREFPKIKTHSYWPLSKAAYVYTHVCKDVQRGVFTLYNICNVYLTLYNVQTFEILFYFSTVVQPFYCFMRTYIDTRPIYIYIHTRTHRCKFFFKCAQRVVKVPKCVYCICIR